MSSSPKGSASTSKALDNKTASITTTAPATTSKTTKEQDPLFVQYPVNAVVELQLIGGESVRGLVYCTDEISNTVVLKKSLVHTTLSSEIRIVNVACIQDKKVIHAVAPDKPSGKGKEGGGGEVAEELAMPLANINKKALEEREKRALRLVEESFRHINEKVRPYNRTMLFFCLSLCSFHSSLFIN